MEIETIKPSYISLRLDPGPAFHAIYGISPVCVLREDQLRICDAILCMVKTQKHTDTDVPPTHLVAFVGAVGIKEGGVERREEEVREEEEIR